MMRTITVTNVELTIRRKRDVGWNKVDWAQSIGGILSRIAVSPQSLALGRRLLDLALVDVAVVQHIVTLFATKAEPVRAAAKLFTERAHEATRRVVNDHRFPAHARLVYGMGYVDESVFVLRQAVGVSPNQAFGRHQPVMYAFIGVGTRSHHRQTAPGFVSSLHKASG